MSYDKRTKNRIEQANKETARLRKKLAGRLAKFCHIPDSFIRQEDAEVLERAATVQVRVLKEVLKLVESVQTRYRRSLKKRKARR